MNVFEIIFKSIILLSFILFTNCLAAKKSKGPPVIAAKPAKLFEENEDDRHNAKQSDADQSAASVFKPAAVPRRKNKEEEVKLNF